MPPEQVTSKSSRAVRGSLGVEGKASDNDAGESAGPAASAGKSSMRVATTGAATSPAPQEAPKWLGKRVGRFRLIGLIGRGANGKVFRAEDVQLHRLVALKVISSRSSRKRTAAEKRELLLREARSAAKLEHPNIVSVYEVASQSDVHFIAMELVEGGNLKDLVTAAGPLDVARACQLAADAAEGLQHAHEQGVVHRDVKPANLMLTRNGRCKLGDFGLARMDDVVEDADGAAVGTPQYVAPEIIEGHEATALSDVYSLGATLFFLLTGSPPFPGEQSREVLRKHLEEPPPDVRTLRPDVPEALALTVWRALAKQPTARFDSAGHVARALRLHTIPLEETLSEPVPEPIGPTKWIVPISPRRLALGVLLGGGLLVALTAGLIVLSTRGGATGQPTTPTTPGDPALTDSSASPRVEPPLPRPGEVLAATETDRLLRVARETDPAKHDGTATVTGFVQRVELPAGQTEYRIDLRGVDRKRGLRITFAPDLLPAMTTRVGGEPASRLPNRRVRVSGTVELYDGQPLLVVRSPEQVTVE